MIFSCFHLYAKNDPFHFFLCTVSLLNIYEDTCLRPSASMVAEFYPLLGVESTWDDKEGNSNSVLNAELMMECNDCLFERLNVQTATTRIERCWRRASAACRRRGGGHQSRWYWILPVFSTYAVHYGWPDLCEARSAGLHLAHAAWASPGQ